MLAHRVCGAGPQLSSWASPMSFDDAYVVHPFEPHVSNLQDAVY